jgi:hypothetical protein
MSRLAFALAVVATTALAGCPELPPGDITSPYYWSDYFLAKYERERAVGAARARARRRWPSRARSCSSPA